MRTGSNLLESKLNMFVDLLSVGEAFNPNFIGSPKAQNVMGISLMDRAQNPIPLVKKSNSPHRPFTALGISMITTRGCFYPACSICAVQK